MGSKLGVNIDHVATLRQARQAAEPEHQRGQPGDRQRGAGTVVALAAGGRPLAAQARRLDQNGEVLLEPILSDELREAAGTQPDFPGALRIDGMRIGPG